MKSLLLGLLALLTLPAHAQIYKWTDANGKIQYADHPQDGVNAKELQVPASHAAPSAANDGWRERERMSRENRARQSEAERRAAAAEEAARAKQKPFNPSVNRSNSAMTDEELCKRDRQQIEFAEKTKNLAILHGSGVPETLTEAQRQDVIRERKANNTLTCGSGRRR